MKVKANSKHAFNSGMRGGEKPSDKYQDSDTAVVPKKSDVASEAPKEKPAGAVASGMRGAADPVSTAQATAHEVAQNPLPGANTEAIAQGKNPTPVLEDGDDYVLRVPKKHFPAAKK